MIGTKLIRYKWYICYFLIIGISQLQAGIEGGKEGCFSCLISFLQNDAFKIHCLSRAVNGTVSEQKGNGFYRQRRLFVTIIIGVKHSVLQKKFISTCFNLQRYIPVLLRFFYVEKAIFIRCIALCPAVFILAAGIIVLCFPKLHGCIVVGLSIVTVKYIIFLLIIVNITNITYIGKLLSYDIFLQRKILIQACDNKVSSIGQCIYFNFGCMALIVLQVGQCYAPCFDGFQCYHIFP